MKISMRDISGQDEPTSPAQTAQDPAKLFGQLSQLVGKVWGQWEAFHELQGKAAELRKQLEALGKASEGEAEKYRGQVESLEFGTPEFEGAENGLDLWDDFERVAEGLASATRFLEETEDLMDSHKIIQDAEKRLTQIKRRI